MNEKTRIAIIGVGNCAKSLLEGLEYYKSGTAVGLMNPLIGGYAVGDIHCVAAFDIDARKVGRLLHEAATAEPNRTLELAPIAYSDVVVKRGHTLDSVIPQMREYYILESEESPCDVTRVLQESRTDIVINYLPSGSDQATYFYAECALKAKCSFVNCMPTRLAGDETWRNRFLNEGIVLLGDDIKSQLGATILNRTLIDVLVRRGVNIATSQQVNYGGNADHFNLHFRPEAKEKSKESALYSVSNGDTGTISARMIYTAENYDHKKAIIEIKGMIFGGAPVTIRVELGDEDSPNSGGCVVDAIRYAKWALETDRKEFLDVVTAYLFKSPYHQMSDFEAVIKLDELRNLAQAREGK